MKVTLQNHDIIKSILDYTVQFILLIIYIIIKTLELKIAYFLEHMCE